MCGIVGLFLKKDDLRPKLGDMLTDMLITMTDRGPDSAGIAIYGDAAEGSTKITVQSKAPETEFDGLEAALSETLGAATYKLVRSASVRQVLQYDAEEWV